MSFPGSNAQNTSTPFAQLLGSSTYMAKILKTEGKLITSTQYAKLLDDYIQQFEPNTEINSLNLVNAIMLRWVIYQHPTIKHWYSLREFKTDNDTTVYSSLWNGYRIYNYPQMTDGIIIELGTGSARFYIGRDNVWSPIKKDISGEEYNTHFWNIDATKSLETLIKYAIDQDIATKQDFDNSVAFGTQKARTFIDGIVNVDILTPEDEGRLEHISVVNAHNLAPQASLQHFTLKATIGYGNGSYQGYNSLNYLKFFTHDFGLKKLMTILGDENHTKSITFNTTDDLHISKKMVKDELYKYEPSIFIKILNKLSMMFL